MRGGPAALMALLGTEGRILETMTNSSGPRPRHLPNSPFAPAREVVVETYDVDDRVCHDLYGLGKVTRVDSHAVTVDFGSQSVRITPPYAKLQHL